MKNWLNLSGITPAGSRGLAGAMKTLFIDFDGTICMDRYWRSLSTEQHEQLQSLLFQEDTTMANDWMRGKYTAEAVNSFVAKKTGIDYEYLWRVFVQDCETMSVPMEVLEKINVLRSDWHVILMTGNMDSFDRFTVPTRNLISTLM